MSILDSLLNYNVQEMFYQFLDIPIVKASGFFGSRDDYCEAKDKAEQSKDTAYPEPPKHSQIICRDADGNVVNYPCELKCKSCSEEDEGPGLFARILEKLSLLSSSDMGPTPFYADLGKKANDVFGKGYHFGTIKLDLKTKSEAGVEFLSNITSFQETGKVFGSLQSKYAVKDYGLTFTEKWNTDNTLATDITIQDQIAVGLKVTLEGTFAPQTGSKSGKLRTAFTNETFSLNSVVDLDRAGPIVDVAGVLKFQGWLAGVLGQFDTQKGKLSKNCFALGYESGDFSLHTNVDNGSDFNGAIYQKVSEKVECGISMKWSSGSADTLFGVGTRVALDKDASLHAKFNNKSIIGLGYSQKLRDGVTITLSAAIDGQNFNAGGHKVGLALELAP